MREAGLTQQQAITYTTRVDIHALPPNGEPTALVVFGTNQAAPACIAVARYWRGQAPLLILTGDANSARLLTTAGVPQAAMRVEYP